MFGIGMPELILILVVALIVIGPKKLPDLAKSLGKAMGEFKKATNEIKDSMQLDSGIKEVKTSFEDLEKELKKPVENAAPATSTETTPLAQDSGEETAAQADTKTMADSEGDSDPELSEVEPEEYASSEKIPDTDESPPEDDPRTAGS